jgi:hypothetical protein
LIACCQTSLFPKNLDREDMAFIMCILLFGEKDSKSEIVFAFRRYLWYLIE